MLQYCFCFMFWCFGWEASGILASQPGIKHVPPTVEGKVLSHWTTRQIPASGHWARLSAVELGEYPYGYSQSLVSAGLVPGQSSPTNTPQQQMPESMDTQVPHIKWCSTAGPRYSQVPHEGPNQPRISIVLKLLVPKAPLISKKIAW